MLETPIQTPWRRAEGLSHSRESGTPLRLRPSRRVWDRIRETRPGPQAAEEAGKQQLSLRPLTAGPWCGGLAGAGLLALPRPDAGRERAVWLAGGRGVRGRPGGESCSPRAPSDVAKANNRGDAEKQKAIRHDLHGRCGVVPAGRTSGRRSGSPRPCRLLRRISRSRHRRRRTSRGPDGRRLRIHAAGAERAARGQRARSPRARGRASAELELQPPPFRSSPHRRPARGCRAGAPTGDPWRPPAEWQLREVRSPGGSSCLPQR
ncbi:uncharacterized protein LOC132024127 [Mustela nigripes]|uniref:uncharacterized protein LOC132024127 n=1 Tax=Mustela nigripes TaxID=77151 RepID=UPI002815DDC8|nr:uncharacterized protein LOC132024127 [Mustela nigripes]